MKADRRRLIAPAAVVAALLLCAVGVHILRDARYRLPTSEEETLYLSRRAVSRLVFTHRLLASDLYWMRALQYFGSHTRAVNARDALEPPDAIAAVPPPSFDLLYPLLDITTTLDPHFRIAYRFGSIFLSEPGTHGPGRPDLAVALLQKAVAAMPDQWQYWHDIGFVYYWSSHDYIKAAEAFNRAADLPHAPWWLRSLAATTLAKGGQRVASRMLWTEMLASAADERARDAAATKLRQLDALEQIELLQARVDQHAATGHPLTWRALVAGGLLRGIPRDPAGVPYELGDDGRVTLSTSSPLFPLPVEPKPRGVS